MKFDMTRVYGAEMAIYGMRAAKESWMNMDSHSYCCENCDCDEKCCHAYPTNGFSIDGIGCYKLGPNDLNLATNLAKAGSDHGKFLRDIHVQVYIEGPLYWWQEMDTYKVATTRLSTSCMHKILSKGFEENDFETERMSELGKLYIEDVRTRLNLFCECYAEIPAKERERKKQFWYNIQGLIPKCYIYGSVLDLNYATLRNIAHSDRAFHKQDEWSVDFFNWMRTLPYNEELIFS